jgi:purine-binding chemotaxis protein CheW
MTGTANSSALETGPVQVRQYSTFDVAGFYFGIDVLQVQEVLRYQELTPVPLAPPTIEGLINLRGQIVTAIDMRRRLGLPPREDDETAMNVVVRTGDGAVSLLVDEIGDVVEADAASFERPPDNLDPVIRKLVSGIHKLKERLLLVLDKDQTIDLSAAEQGAAA